MALYGSNQGSFSCRGIDVTTKSCSKCRIVKNLDEFYMDPRNKSRRQSQCKQCLCTWIKNHYRAHPVEHILRRAVARAARKNIECTITLDDIRPLPTHCPVFGFELTRGNGMQDPTAFSLDRIDNSKGYIPGNVVVISYLANRLKNDGTAAQHERIAQWMRAYGAG